MSTLTWTSEKPTRPGWYWWRGNVTEPQEDWCVFQVWEEVVDKENRVMRVSYKEQAIDAMVRKWPGSQWAGPLRVPEIARLKDASESLEQPSPLRNVETIYSTTTGRITPDPTGDLIRKLQADLAACEQSWRETTVAIVKQRDSLQQQLAALTQERDKQELLNAFYLEGLEKSQRRIAQLEAALKAIIPRAQQGLAVFTIGDNKEDGWWMTDVTYESLLANLDAICEQAQHALEGK